jgi:hypothetical protein
MCRQLTGVTLGDTGFDDVGVPDDWPAGGEIKGGV